MDNYHGYDDSAVARTQPDLALAEQDVDMTYVEAYVTSFLWGVV